MITESTILSIQGKSVIMTPRYGILVPRRKRFAFVIFHGLYNVAIPGPGIWADTITREDI